tara:strand:+ start:91 stop:729 length:639 start_codon:yes stop_codon:yes gene_type:complete
MILIDFSQICNILYTYHINILGILHIGACDCDELDDYINYFKLLPSNIIWIDANSQKVIDNKLKGIVNIYDYLITDKDDDIIKFNISNDSESSSILELKDHTIEYPNIYYLSHQIKKSITIDTFINKYSINVNKFNFLLLHIQGSELLALNGALKYLNYVKCIYIKIHYKELYYNNPSVNDLDLFLNNYCFYRVLIKFNNYGWGDAIYIKKD